MGASDALDIKSQISGCIVETFSTMLSLDIRPVDSDQSPTSGVQRMVGTLNFAGAVTGIFNLQVTYDFGRRMAAALHGIEPEQIGPGSDVRDLIAEITNIVGGNLKSALDDAGQHCILSTPSITTGTDFSIRSLSMERFERCVYQHADDFLVVEVGLKTVATAEGRSDISSPGAMSRLPEVDLVKLAALDFKTRIGAAAADVFDTMLSLKLEPVEAVDSAGLGGRRAVVSSVCFAGDATGIVSVHLPEEFARILTSKMLGMDPTELEGLDEIRDLLGELGNMIGGNLKSALTDAGLRCSLSAPSFTTGSDFKIESLNLERYERYAFACEGQNVFVEMGIKISDHMQKDQQTGKVPQKQMASALDGLADEPPAAAVKNPAAAPRPPADETNKLPGAAEDLGLEILLDIPMELTVELGRTKLPIRELLKLSPGSAVKLAKFEGEPVDILANDVLIARGEVVVRNEKYGIRITEITSRMERLKGLR
ncbi:MAG: flagellar motor switch protein FliN [Desulfobacterales bacterium]